MTGWQLKRHGSTHEMTELSLLEDGAIVYPEVKNNVDTREGLPIMVIVHEPIEILQTPESQKIILIDGKEWAEFHLEVKKNKGQWSHITQIWDRRWRIMWLRNNAPVARGRIDTIVLADRVVSILRIPVTLMDNLSKYSARVIKLDGLTCTVVDNGEFIQVIHPIHQVETPEVMLRVQNAPQITGKLRVANHGFRPGERATLCATIEGSGACRSEFVYQEKWAEIFC